jgi:mannose-6-phosphate isomerase-like protein (cupin superfamily)
MADETLNIFGVAIRLHLRAAETSGRLGLFEEETPPGLGPPLHRHNGEAEFFRVIAGTYRFRIGEEERDATEGDTLFVPAGTPHTFLNTGSSPGRLFMGFTPGGAEAFFEAVAQAAYQLPQDSEAIATLGQAYRLDFLGPNPLG